MFKDKPNERCVPEKLFDAAAEVERVAPLTGLGAFEREVRGRDHCTMVQIGVSCDHIVFGVFLLKHSLNLNSYGQKNIL